MTSVVRRIDPSVYLFSGSTPGAPAGDASAFTARLTDPLVVDSQTRVALTGLEFDWHETIVVAAGENDTVGTKNAVSEGGINLVVARPGTYTLASLAEELCLQLNAVGSVGGLAGGWRATFDPKTYFSIEFRRSGAVPPPVPDVALTNCTYIIEPNPPGGNNYSGGGKLTISSADEAKAVFPPIAFQDADFYFRFQTSSASDGTHRLALFLDPAVSATEFGYLYTWTAGSPNTATITPIVRGVAGTPVAAAALWDSGDFIYARKIGNSLRFYRVPSPATSPEAGSGTAPFLQLTLDPALDGDAALQEPAMAPVIMTNIGGGGSSSFSADRIKANLNTFASSVWRVVDGVEKRVYVGPDLTPENLSTVFPPDEGLGASFATSGRPTLDFTVPNSIALLLGFDPSVVYRPTVSAKNHTFVSTQAPLGSLGTASLDALFVHSDLNVGSIVGGAQHHSAPGILAAIPAQIAGAETFISYQPPAPVYKHLNVSEKRLISTISLEMRDRSGARIGTLNGSSAVVHLQFLDAIAVG